MPFPGIPAEALSALAEPSVATQARLTEALRDSKAPPDAAARVLEYARLLLAANTSTNLTGARGWDDLVEAHLEDTLRALALVPPRARVLADWGSGAGLPGLVWALVRPEWNLHLVERNEKKAGFLREVAQRLAARNVQVHARQLHEILGVLVPRADAIVARAVEPLPALLARLAGERVPRIPLLWMAGPGWEGEFDALPPARRAHWRAEPLGRYALATGRGERALVRFTRAEASR
jgi:16S rRNA (guanine527-N7)-methyltransferase